MEGAKEILECGKRENGNRTARKHLEVVGFFEREKWGLRFGLDEIGE